MASPETPLSIVAEWKRKACDISEESIDALPSIFSRTLEAISIILKNPKQCHIQRALASIESDLSTCLRFEETNEPSIRSLMFGLIEALHLTLTHLMDGRRELNEKTVSTIGEWKKKSAEFSNGSSDLLASVISHAFDAMFIIIKNSDLISILRALGTLDFERKQSLGFEKIEEFSIRSLMYGTIESIHATLLHLTEKKNEHKSAEEESNKEKPLPICSALRDSSDLMSTHSLDQLSTTPTFTKSAQLDLKEEPLDSSQSNIGKNEFLPLEEEIKEEPIEFPLLDLPLGLGLIEDGIKKEEIPDDDLKEPTDKHIDAPLSDVNQQFNLEFIDEFKEEPISNEDMGNDIGNLDPSGDELIENGTGEEGHNAGDANLNVDDMIEGGGDNETVEHIADNTQSFETVEVNKRRRSSRIVSRSVKYAESMEESDGSDEDGEPLVKKMRSESVEKKENAIPQKRIPFKGSSKSNSGNKKSDENENDKGKNELECPECEYRSRSVNAWGIHLRRNHSTNPALAGCRLRCDCGHESYSHGHSLECTISNFTVIRKGDGIIRRLTDPMITPQCVLCEDSSETEVGKRRRSSRKVSKSVTYSMEESDGEDEPYVKKKRTESMEKDEKAVPQKKMSSCKGSSNSVQKDKGEEENETEKKWLECPECEYRSKSANAWDHHLRRDHSTTPKQAHCLLRCDCGHESYSPGHSRKCDIANFTIIRTNTPQCVLCKARPKTPIGYTHHLKEHHETTLIANGIFLLCSCGLKFSSDYNKKHYNECTGHEYSLHKLDED